MLKKSLREKAPESDVFGLEEALAKISTKLMSPEDIDLLALSDLTPDEIFGVPLLQAYADVFGSTIMNNWTKRFLKGRISRFRKGRGEGLVLGIGQKQEQQKRSSGIKDLFAGLG